MLRRLLLSLFGWTSIVSLALAQSPTSTRPTEGLRTAATAAILLHGGEVIARPGAQPVPHDVLIRGTVIVAVGPSLDVPTGTKRIDASGKRIYAGLIDAMHDVDVSLDVLNGGNEATGYWNANVSPQLQATAVARTDITDVKKLRAQGIAAQLIAPKDGIIKGSSCLVLMIDPNDPQRLVRSDVFQHATLTVPRGRSRDRYPNSPMGATALLRQSLYDAQWYREANRIHDITPTLSRPQRSAALDAIQRLFESQTIVIDAANERMAIRAMSLADEFSLPMVLRGSGREYRAIDEIARTGQKILLPIDFPEPPSTATKESVRSTELVDWMHWRFAPENPARLNAAGVSFCLTTDGMDDPGKFLQRIRTAIERGLDPVVAHAAVTTTPAQWMNVDDNLGQLQPGMMANLVITDGELFGEKTKVLETWIAGQPFIVTEPTTDTDPLAERWSLTLTSAGKQVPVTLTIQSKDNAWTAEIERDPEPTETSSDPAESPAEGPAKDPAEATKTEGEAGAGATVSETEKAAEVEKAKPVNVKLENVIRERQRFSAKANLSKLGEEFDVGLWHLEILSVNYDQDANTAADRFASLASPDDVLQRPKLTPVEVTEQNKDKAEEEIKEDGKVDIAMTFPLGAHGLTAPPTAHDTILFRGATVWTSGPLGKLPQADILVRNGKIAEIGADLATPESCHVVDASGKHITPGLIDCHSHIATDGGVNESGQAITAEVRIGDFIDNSDVAIYRQLAGGVTAANIMHGSANPIGGQSQTIKFRWGASMKEMKFAGAPAGIKFALGENVKRSNNRYPNTRMGVEQLLRDQFLATRQYEADQVAWRSGQRDQLPPRRDLQLDALVEVQRGDRWIHCHSYRQDEIVATLDVLEEFNIRIGTLQHILEGYKVSDRIVAHGAMASTFADWWAYKFEVFDAIPYNGVLMHNAGVVVSYNSDDPELGRHLNTEAAKATKYGGVDEQEALKFVTLNPAKQLRIDDRVGSIEVGKDADLVIWSGRPLSTTTRCEQTWIDGKCYFSIDDDAKMRQRDRQLRNRLIQLAIGEKPKAKPKANADVEPEQTEEERWLRFDEFCNANQRTGGSR